jgi:hypothetical protein
VAVAEPAQVPLDAGPGQVVEQADAVPLLREPVARFVPDEPGAAGDECDGTVTA